MESWSMSCKVARLEDRSCETAIVLTPSDGNAPSISAEEKKNDLTSTNKRMNVQAELQNLILKLDDKKQAEKNATEGEQSTQ